MNPLSMEELHTAPLHELKALYRRHFPDKAVIPTHPGYLARRIAYKLQEVALGGISHKAKSKLAALIQIFDPVNNASIKPQISPAGLLPIRDRRLPLPGSIITKDYKGRKISVKTLEKGFEYEGRIYRTLSAVAHAITGAHWNGFMFFDL
jgi:hypothetical protein